jgi:hypothetical protein
MVAVVKSGRIHGLTPNNAMSRSWMTEMWQSQYPQEMHSLCDFSIESFKKAKVPDLSMRYCPSYIAPK